MMNIQSRCVSAPATRGNHRWEFDAADGKADDRLAADGLSRASSRPWSPCSRRDDHVESSPTKLRSSAVSSGASATGPWTLSAPGALGRRQYGSTELVRQLVRSMSTSSSPVVADPRLVTSSWMRRPAVADQMPRQQQRAGEFAFSNFRAARDAWAK
jgi:hypothetical protein